MQDRLRGKTENQQPQQKEKGTKLENFKTEKISNNKLLAVKKSGEHWILLCAIDNGDRVGIFVWDCLGRPLCYYDQFYSRLWKLYGKCGGFRTINLPMQNLHSNLCSLYCLYLVHYLVRKPFNVYKLQTNPSLMQTTEIDIVRFFNEHVKYSQFRYRTW